jgi:mannose-6-phosphate isomerase-like protein (cupin superfamily)
VLSRRIPLSILVQASGGSVRKISRGTIMKRNVLVAIFCAGIVVGITGGVGATLFFGKITSAAEKNSSKIILENDKVRVKEAIFVPGDNKPGMHTHEFPHVGVAIDGGKLKFNYPDGKTETLDLKPGGAGYREANVTHEAVNIGSKPVRVIEVEIK